MKTPNRLKLHNMLVEILGSNQVYYQPPVNVKMSYPAIVYELANVSNTPADNGKYLIKYNYKITLITKEAEPETANRIYELDRCGFSTSFKSDGLNHFVFNKTL